MNPIEEELHRLREERARFNSVEAQLRERVKELDCLVQVARILHSQEPELEPPLRRVAEAIPPAWQHPQRTCVRIRLDGLCVESGGFAEGALRLVEPLQIDGLPAGSIEVVWRGDAPPDGSDPFLESERRLLQAIAGLIEGRVIQRQTEAALQRAAEELQAQKLRLEQKNIALREVLEQVEAEKRELKEQVAANVERLVLPIVRRLRDPHTPEPMRARTLDSLESSLADLASAWSRRIVSDQVRLSPREVEIAMRVRDGFSTKEIGEQLHVSQLTVERHRHNIRRKLGIAGDKVNLITYLKQL